MDRLKQLADVTQGEPTEELTKSPQMNKVIMEARRVIQGTGDSILLQNRINDVEMVVEQLHQFFKYESRFQEKTDFFKKEAEVIEFNFDRVRRYIERMKKYYEKPENRYLEEGLDGCKRGFFRLFESFDRLKDQEQKRKIYSKSPYLNEVIRVGHGAINGTLTVDAFRERIDALLRLQENFLFNFENFKPTEDERLVYEENRDYIREQVETMLEGLREARKFITDSNAEHIHKGLKQADIAADQLLEFEKKLKDAREAPKVKYCFKCGAENPRDIRYCVKCNFNFPQLQIKDESTVDVRLEEGGITETGHVMTENLARLAGAVEDIKIDKITLEEFLEVLDWFGDLIEKAKAEADRIEEPKDITDKEAKEAFDNFKEVFYLGLTDVETGLENLYVFTETQNPALLDSGMESIFRGGDRLYQVQATAQQLRDQMIQHQKQQAEQAEPES